jgi:hypothetical protein
VGGKGGCHEKEGEVRICKSRKEGVQEGGGRVSNTIKTLEQGAKQKNNIFTYISKFGGGVGMGRQRGHPLAAEKLCVGVKRELEYIILKVRMVVWGQLRIDRDETN